MASLVFTCERHKPDRQDLPGCQLAIFAFFHQGQLLNLERGANRDQHYTTGFQLRYKGWRDMAACSSHHDCIKGCVRLPAVITVCVLNLDIAKAKTLQKL